CGRKNFVFYISRFHGDCKVESLSILRAEKSSKHSASFRDMFPVKLRHFFRECNCKGPGGFRHMQKRQSRLAPPRQSHRMSQCQPRRRRKVDRRQDLIDSHLPPFAGGLSYKVFAARGPPKMASLRGKYSRRLDSENITGMITPGKASS